jgi:hypothetical protein
MDGETHATFPVVPGGGKDLAYGFCCEMDIWHLTLIFAFSSSLFSSPLTSDDICRDAMPPRRFLKLNEEMAVTWLGAAQENKTRHLPQF